MAEPIRRADDLWIEDLDEEIVILVGETDQIHVLNETAAELWRLVDGGRDRAKLVAAFSELYSDVDRGALSEDVDAVLADFAEKGLVVL